MRDIKFRGKRVDTGEWAYGHLFSEGCYCFIIGNDSDTEWNIDLGVYLINGNGMIEIDPKTVGEYTGLKDKNGVEIYEGDILKCKMFDGRFENYEVLWEKNEVCWEAWNIDRSNWIVPRVWGEQEVVGNIYENQELLRGGCNNEGV